MVHSLLGPNRRNLVTIGVIGVLLVSAYFLVPHWSTKYGAWLVIFTIWMVWFVATFVQWLSTSDF
jgi:hypothetical protein